MTEQTKNRLLTYLWGLGGMVTAILLALLMWGAWTVWHRAANGEAAYQFIMQVQAQQRASTPPPAK